MPVFGAVENSLSMPTYPWLIEHLTTTTTFALLTSRIGMPEIAWPGGGTASSAKGT
ncbi:hypothetical protein ACRJ4W_13025 [Streptomyces sp. GLT-R25]